MDVRLNYASREGGDAKESRRESEKHQVVCGSANFPGRNQIERRKPMHQSRSIFLTAVHISFFALAAFADDTAPASAAGVVNINTADAAQIAYLPRVGASAA